MIKKIAITAVILLVILGTLGGIKGLQIGKMVAQGKQFVPPPETVTTAVVRSEDWESVMTAVGSLDAVQGVTVAAELSGRVVKIAFEPGTKVEAGDLLVQQDTATERARLRAAEASLKLARNELKRSETLIKRRTISQSKYDRDLATYQQAQAEVDNIKTIIEKKTIRAPFSGRLGIRLVDLGQILNESAPLVSLQALDPIFVNFFLPQQKLSEIREGYTVRLTIDSLADEQIEGIITAINPEIDDRTRNVRIQATVPNPDEKLRPGMFANVSVVLPTRGSVLAIPATAVLYAPYSDSVFVVQTKENESGQPAYTVQQQFVRLGKKNGDFVAVEEGLEAGQTVVSTGVFKLRNGQSVVVDNALAPDFKLAPSPEDS
jgi:membrane fusion protein (multidrug efflux system)